MNLRPYLQRVGRGRKGAGDLSTEEAHAVFTSLLKSEVDAAQVGAFLVAMRLKGESVDELEGLMRAAHEHLNPVPVAGPRPVVVLASYNGARRHANLLPWLAWLLREAGAAVLVHGVEHDADRVTTHEVWQALGWPIADSSAAAGAQLAREGLSFCALRVLSPALHGLLQWRTTLGLRNSGHVVAKLLQPLRGAALPVCNFTHPEYPPLLSALFARGGGPAIAMRGHEGEAIASAQRLPEMRLLGLPGQADEIVQELWSTSAEAPVRRDAAANADLIRTYVRRQEPAPRTIALEAEAIVRALTRLGTYPPAHLRA